MSEPGETELRRPHPLTGLIRGWGIFAAFAFAFVKEYKPGDGTAFGLRLSDLRTVALLALAVVVVGALLGLASWWFTKFVVDEHEVRIESGWLFRSTKQIAVDRIQSVDVVQPLSARIFGLCEVTIDVGAGTHTRLRYLTRSDAYAMRDLLLARAHGHTVVADPAAGSALDHLRDIAADETVLVQIAPTKLVLSAVMSTEVWSFLANAAVFAAIAVWAKMPLLGAVGVIPTLLGLFKMISDRVMGQWGYRLSTSPRGLKVSRGLLSLTSQSVPVHRIQGLRITQPWPWRFLGLYRVDIDVLGYGAATTDEDTTGTSTILLPAGSADDVAVALRHTMPGLDLSTIQLHGSDRAARWLHPIGWKAQRWGMNATHVVTCHSPWNQVMNVVPHARVQGLELAQGPLNQALGMASVHVRTADGPVSATIKQVPLETALALVPVELATARQARGDQGRRLLV